MQPIPADILICPKTKTRITIDAANGVARAEQSSISYPIKEGIIDFLPDTVDRISKAYDSFAASYDEYMTASGLHWKLYTLIAWGFLDASDFLQKPLSSIPSDFGGVLLDVPVGTGYFTAPFFNEQECLFEFGKYFNIRYTGNVKSGLYFEMIRNEATAF